MEYILAACVLLFSTILASLLFYRRIARARNEYEESRDLVRNIVLSFSRELSRERKQLKAVSLVSDEALKRSMEASSVAENSSSEVKVLSTRVDAMGQQLASLNGQVQSLSSIREQNNEVKLRTPEATATVEYLAKPAVQRRREGVLSQLNPTEMTVLELLDKEGELTVPKIMERIGKTREHTARLLKKIYEDGFIDRNTGSMPYKYNIRRELKELLKEQARVGAV